MGRLLQALAVAVEVALIAVVLTATAPPPEAPPPMVTVSPQECHYTAAGIARLVYRSDPLAQRYGAAAAVQIVEGHIQLLSPVGPPFPGEWAREEAIRIVFETPLR